MYTINSLNEDKGQILRLRSQTYKFNILNHGKIKKAIQFAFDNFNKPIPFWQVHDEILGLIEILDKEKPKLVLEIGTAGGGSLFLITQVSSEDATIISVDLPHGQFGGGYPESRMPLYKSFAWVEQKIHLLRNDSHSLNTLNSIKNILNDNKLDFLFIDGDHTYEGVKKDFDLYSFLVRENGIIAFHDIVPGPATAVGGVPQFWIEIKNNYKYLEIVKDWNQIGCGVGLIYQNSKGSILK